MPIAIRKRGDVWYARGTVRVGDQTVKVREYSTGCRARGDAEAQASSHEAAVRAEILSGPEGRARKLTIADAISAYQKRPGGVPMYDIDRLTDLNDRIGDRPLAAASDAWNLWLGTRGASMAPGTAARWRAILQAALTHAAKANGLAVPRLPTVRQKTDERVVYLTLMEREKLLACYSSAARPVAQILAYQGLRTQEALRLDWRNVDWRRSTLYISITKTGVPRTVPMHSRVELTLAQIWKIRQYPSSGPVFLSSRGEPYTDTRATGSGGNPLSKAHKTACRKAGITGFRVHDWRHDWAAHMVMSGCDIITLMRLGGWRSTKMVQRYASVTTEHMAEAMERLK
jgi:integrase